MNNKNEHQNQEDNTSFNSHKQEQEYIYMLYSRLRELQKEQEKKLKDIYAQTASGSPQNRSERDAFAARYEDNLNKLNSVHEKLCFGKLEYKENASNFKNPYQKNSVFIGKIGLTDEKLDSILVDWRAPASAPFYQATLFDNKGVNCRKYISTQGEEIVSVNTENLELDLNAKEASSDVENNEGSSAIQLNSALKDALKAKRTGFMREIVTTIQSEQDKIIRLDHNTMLVVQGAPGTGKTAIALHRAAYLLYTHRERLEKSGILVVGPSKTFGKYISQVLPSLGENSVVISTIEQLLPGIDTKNVEDSVQIAKIKGGLNMRAVLQKAVRNRIRLPKKDETVNIGGVKVVLSRKLISSAQRHAMHSGKPYNFARRIFIAQALELLGRQMVIASGLAGHNEQLNREDIDSKIDLLKLNESVKILLNLCWMPISPQKFVLSLFTNKKILDYSANGILKKYQKEQLITETQKKLEKSGLNINYSDLDSFEWSRSDIAILDEAFELLDIPEPQYYQRIVQKNSSEDYDNENGFVLSDQDSDALSKEEKEYAAQSLATSGVPNLTKIEFEEHLKSFIGSNDQNSDKYDRNWKYGHIIVDEAQEISPMEWRMLFRRCTSRSMTIVGDLGQAHNDFGLKSWDEQFTGAAKNRLNIQVLSVNYRTPQKIMNFAMKFAKNSSLPTTPVKSVREVENAISLYENANENIVQIVNDLINLGGSIAVVAPENELETLNNLLKDNGIDSKTTTDKDTLFAKVAVLTPKDTKGLEFNCVLLYNPNEIMKENRGTQDLFVAITRATDYLVIYTKEPLCSQLQKALDSAI